MWMTLFDDIEDDEYDGAMGIQDDEDPRILVDLTVSQVAKKIVAEPSPRPIKQQEAPIKPSPIRHSLEAKRTPEPTSQPKKSYMEPIGNFRDQKRYESISHREITPNRSGTLSHKQRTPVQETRPIDLNRGSDRKSTTVMPASARKFTDIK
jgi:hypothetical protein